MKPVLALPLLALAGIGVGGGAAFGVRTLMPASEAQPEQPVAEMTTSFTPTGKILAPLVYADGRLSGYVQFDVQLETNEEDAAFVTPRMPVLLNAINMRTFRAPMASGPDGMLPNLEVFRKLVKASADEAFGPKVVRRVVITQAGPA
ncbi:flagellar basal body-associated FliL family protein [Sphingomonas sp. 37zxx]|uniref:flagellar basal body-associated FliL family protein n=1 Tax=Sphingomonas sp. 37zxx TaxID=1550073 RepID=UPI00053BF6EB|nr:flagellar basal body-associated FliL family protein [Sphingomonas sp. 37zxx]